MRKIMKRAHQIAKGLEGDYRARMSLALRKAWQENKGGNEMEITSKWTTGGGATVEMTTKEIRETEVDLDGDKVKVPADNILITEVKMNGKEYTGHMTAKKYQGKLVLDMGLQKHNGTMTRLMVLMPEDIYQAVWGEQDKREAEKLEREMASMRAAQKRQEKLRASGLCPKCNTWCYGDCQAS